MSKAPMGDARSSGSDRRARFWHLVGRDDRLPIDPDLAPDDPAEPSASHRRSAVRIHRHDPLVLASIALGGFIGALARYEVGLTWPVRRGSFPMTTFLINTSGAFALGLILTFLLERLAPGRYLRPFACVGILGAWTTMSTLATESDVLVKDGHPNTALIYVAATLVAGLIASFAGIAVARRKGPAQ